MTLVLKENEKQTMSLSEDDFSFLSNGVFESKFKVRRLIGGVGYEVTPLNIVGALSLPSGISIIIKPKLPMPNIFRMLSFVSDLYRPLDSSFDYADDVDLFDIIGNMFAQEMSRILRIGLKQNYSQHGESLRTLRGRIDFTKSIADSLAVVDKLFCRFSKLSLDTPLNRAIVKGAEVLLQSSAIKPETKKKVRACLSHIPIDLVGSNFTLTDFKSISLDRSTQYYERIIFLSRFVLENAAYSDDAGKNRFSGFLLDVSKLFEKYIEKSLVLENGQWDLRVLPQKQSKLDLENELTCKPDLTFISVDGIRCIADIKYKDFSNLKFLNDDVYQMVTYLLQSRCNEGFLIYPVFQKDRIGKIKTIHIPHETGSFVIHALCISVETPETVVAQIQNLIPAASEKMLAPA